MFISVPRGLRGVLPQLQLHRGVPGWLLGRLIPGVPSHQLAHSCAASHQLYSLYLSQSTDLPVLYQRSLLQSVAASTRQYLDIRTRGDFSSEAHQPLS